MAMARGRSPGPGLGQRSVPDRRDLRKYARLFMRTDQDMDGFITADEAHNLFSNSLLPPDVLVKIWELTALSQNGALNFPEFVAAMHLIRQARQTQQAPSALSQDLILFLGSLQETPQDLACEGSSRSASRNRSLSPGPAMSGDSTLPRRHEDSAPSFPSTAPGIGSPTFGASAADISSSDFFGASSPPPVASFGDQTGASAGAWGDAGQFGNDAFGETMEQSRKHKKKDKKKDKEKDKEKEHSSQSFGAALESGDAAWGAAPAGGSPLGSPLAAFGREKSVSGLHQRSPHGSPTLGDAFGSSIGGAPAFDELPGLGGGNFSPSHGNFSPSHGTGRLSPSRGDGRAFSFRGDREPEREPGLGRSPPSTRLGLPVTEASLERDFGSRRDSQDPHYAARLREILGIRGEGPAESDLLGNHLDRGYVSGPSREGLHGGSRATQWAGRRNDGAFDERHHNAYAHIGDYGSRAMYTTLMGMQSISSTSVGSLASSPSAASEQFVPRVLPAAAKPFLKSVTPHFPAELAKPAFVERPGAGMTLSVLASSHGIGSSRRLTSPSPLRPTTLSY